MAKDTILIFTRAGMGEAPAELQMNLAVKFLTLLLANHDLPAKIFFYTEGVKLACAGSPALEALGALQDAGVELILCTTCLDFLHLTDKVAIGIPGSMADIVEGVQKAKKVVSL